MFAYDYKNKFTLRVWGSTFKPSLFKELKKLGVKVYDRVEATGLLTTTINGKKRGIGAMGMNVRTGKFHIFKSKTTILTMSRPARVWLFDSDLTGLCEFRPFQSRLRVHYVAVSQSAQHQKIAQAMLTRLCIMYDSIPSKYPLYLVTQSQSYGAIKCYSRLGFTPYLGAYHGSSEQKSKQAWQSVMQILADRS